MKFGDNHSWFRVLNNLYSKHLIYHIKELPENWRKKYQLESHNLIDLHNREETLTN